MVVLHFELLESRLKLVLSPLEFSLQFLSSSQLEVQLNNMEWTKNKFNDLQQLCTIQISLWRNSLDGEAVELTPNGKSCGHTNDNHG